MVHNVRLEEIIEGICVAMHMLSREPGTRLHLSRFRSRKSGSCIVIADSTAYTVQSHLKRS
ncbi:unnamed protein product [Hydatigera taeniaeformis]|uniref:Uncharacterized protein n=1 Tax=Hydatigena taeniaeformis TaxID=6205 RepID=A0A0R3WW73_HYDTA|nr:unnamed protein product [Hydatigera taeniaeformis]